MTCLPTGPAAQAALKPGRVDPLTQRLAQFVLNEHRNGLYGFCTATTCIRQGTLWPCDKAELAAQSLGHRLEPSERSKMKAVTR